MRAALRVCALVWLLMSVSHVGSANGTTSATLPAFNDGDLCLVLAFRDGSTTAPSLPSGWTNLNTTGANTCSSRMGYRVLRTGDTTTGTWTNASRTVCSVYRSSFGGGHVRPGGIASATGSSTTVSYPALTMQQGDGTSWVWGAAGHRSTNTTLETAPTGMTNRNNSVDATCEISAHDTNGGVASWSLQTVAVGGTSSGWAGHTCELREFTGTGIQLVNSVRSAGASGTGTTLTAAMQVSKDSWLVFGSRYENAAPQAITISDDTTGESYASSIAHHAAGSDDIGVDLSAGTTGQSGLVTFTQTVAATSTFREFFVLEYVNVATASQLDKTDTRTHVSANPSTDAFTPDTNGELIVGIAGNVGSTTYNAAGSFTERFDGAVATDTQIQDFVQTTAASLSSTWTAANDTHILAAASYRPFVAAGAAGALVYAPNPMAALLVR